MHAVIEIGSKSIRLLIGEFNGVSVVAKKSMSVAISLSTIISQHQGAKAKCVQEIKDCITLFKKHCYDYGVEKPYIFGTQAARTLNEDKYFKDIFEEYSVSIISANQEALFAFLAAESGGLVEDTCTTLIIDQGARSAELLLVSPKSNIDDFRSYSFEHSFSDIFKEYGKEYFDFEKLDHYFSQNLKVEDFILKFDNLIIMGSAATKCAYISNQPKRGEPFVPLAVHGKTLSVVSLQRFLNLFRKIPIRDWSKFSQLFDPSNNNPQEVRNILIGSAELIYIMRALDVESAKVSAFGTRFGALIATYNV